MGHLRSHPPRVLLALLVLLLCAPTLRAETARATAPPTSGGPARATADVMPTAAGASARARATRERVEVVAERGDAARVFANPEGTFTREQSLRPHGAAAPANRLRAGDNQPQWSSGPGGWALVYGLPGDLRGQSYWPGDGDGVAKVGFSSWERPTVLVRSYFQYDVGALAGKQVLRAEFNVFESYAPSCTPQPVQVWQTGVVEPWTTWDTQPPAIRELDTRTVANGYDSRCPVDWVGFDVTAAAQDAAAGNRLVTLMLRAPDEGDRYQWKKFRPDPRLIVSYNSPPEPPSALAVGDRNGDLACGVQPHEPYVRTGTPTLRATVGDPDGGPGAAEFEWWARGERPLGSRGTVMRTSGTSFSVAVPDDVFGDGARIGWRVRGWDGTAHGPWSGWCDVTVDGTAPAAPPIVGSTDYPPDGFGGGIGRTGRFALRTGGDADIVRFRYGLVTPPTREVAAVDGAASVEVTPAVGDPHDLYVVGVDRAGNESPPTAYHFRVRTTRFPPVRHWRLDGHAPETAVPDALGRGSTGTLVPGQTAWDTGRVGDAVWFDGLAGHLSLGPTSTIHTGGSFSVAAWVRLDRLDGSWRTAVSQAGDRASGFYPQYRSDTRQWAFTVPSADVDDFAGDRVSGDAPVRPHVWTHLVGVYDAGEEQIRLYVDGRFAGRAPHATRWHAAGPVHIGDARFDGAAVDFRPGAVDDVRLYDRVLTDGRVNPGDRVAPDSDVHTLATKPAEPAGRWTFEENTPDSTADTSGQRRAGTFVGGASWTPVGTGRAVLPDGVDDHVVVAGVPARTDAGFTVGARVRADAARTDMTAVSRSEAGTARSALRYDARRRAWEFVVTADDTDDAPRWTATAPVTAVTGRWTHLAGVHDTAAEELRLYVDGVLQAVARAGPSRPIDEGLRIGAHLTRGVPDEFWAGAIDDVRLYRGVRAPDQIADEADDPTEGTVFARDGLHRSLAHDGEHTTTGGAGAAGLAPPGSHLEYELGWYAPEGAAGTRVLYSCLLGDDQFTSVDPRCEGHRLLGALGSIHAEAPGDEPVIDLYRCRTAGGEHYDSVHDDCDGGGTREFRLGRLRAYAPLIRYVQPDAPADHTSTVGGTAPGYRAEGRIGVLSLVQRPGTRLLFACRDGTDTFTSLDSACEGGHGLRTLGWIHSRAAIPGDDRCPRTSYARNRETRPVSAVGRVEVVAVACATPPRFPEHAVSDERTHYDGLAWAEPPTAGDATLREKVAAYADGRPRYVPVTRTRHDVHGRVLESVDALDRRTVTAFAPPTGPPQTSTSTNPLGHTTTTTLFRAWAEPQAVVDANGRRTEFVRDPLGRLTEVWMPGSAAGSRRLHERYTYTMRKDGTSHVATATAKADGGLVTEYSLHDGMLRARQTQKPAWGGGRVVTDTFHDPRGLVVRTNSAYNTVGEPDGNLVGADPIAVPAYTTTRFDGAARPVLATTPPATGTWRPGRARTARPRPSVPTTTHRRAPPSRTPCGPSPPALATPASSRTPTAPPAPPPFVPARTAMRSTSLGTRRTVRPR
ncbi:LamG-like jellyroll fold domain-containing protein [Embleya sp. NPDC005971]|uniref:LamG-like jellyroll fold domain-containing protein n=1 Tax=Embleya sp. NPDC005971 TaxID=3156724 RepID=UPI0033DEB2BD